MEKFPEQLKLNLFDETNKKSLQNQYILSILRKNIFEKLILSDMTSSKNSQDSNNNTQNNTQNNIDEITIDLHGLQIGEKTLYKIDKNITQQIMKELNELGWFTYLYYGDTWLVISKDKNLSLNNMPNTISFE